MEARQAACVSGGRLASGEPGSDYAAIPRLRAVPSGHADDKRVLLTCTTIALATQAPFWSQLDDASARPGDATALTGLLNLLTPGREIERFQPFCERKRLR